MVNEENLGKITDQQDTTNTKCIYKNWRNKTRKEWWKYSISKNNLKSVVNWKRWIRRNLMG